MEEKIRELLQEIQPGIEFSEGVDFVEDGYIDSFDVVTLVAELEKTYSISISAMDIIPDNFGSISAISALVKRSKKIPKNE